MVLHARRLEKPWTDASPSAVRWGISIHNRYVTACKYAIGPRRASADWLGRCAGTCAAPRPDYVLRIIKGLADKDYGLRAFVFEDLDGNRIDVGLKLVPLRAHSEIRGAYAIFRNIEQPLADDLVGLPCTYRHFISGK